MDQFEIERFHRDLSAALCADIPLVVGKDQRLTESELDNLRKQFTADVDDPQRFISDTDPANWLDDRLPKWYRAALAVFARTGSMLPVLEGLSVRRLAARDVRRALRWTFIYLFIVATTALLGLCLFALWVVPSITYFRDDLLLPVAIEVTDRFDVLPWVPWIIGILASGLTLTTLGMMVGGFAWLSPWLGGRRYVCSALSMTILRIAQSLVQAGVTVNNAIAIGFALTNAEANIRKEVQAMIQGSDRADAIGQMADCLRLTANNQLARLRIVTPVFITAVLGGGLVLIYCLIVFWPIVSLLRDLQTAGV